MDFRDVPFFYVPLEVRLKLLNLDIPSSGYGNNWKFLAGQLGFSGNQVLSLETKKSSHGSNTLKLFEEYSKDLSNTVGKLIEALKQIKRPRESNELEGAEKQILHAYDVSKVSTFGLSLASEDKSSQYMYNSQNDAKSNNLDTYYSNFDAITSISGYQVPFLKSSSYYQKTSNYYTQHNSVRNSSKYFCEDLDNESSSSSLLPKNSGKYSVSGLKVTLPPEDHFSSKKFGSIRLFISYPDGEKSFLRNVLSLCQHLDLLFHCNVDLKNHRLNKQKVEDYFQYADFVLVCCNKEYKKSVEFQSNLINDENPQALHTKLIYDNMYDLYTSGKNIDHFIPVVLNGCTVSDIPNWLIKDSIFMWPSQKKDIISYITSKKQLLL
ncbi:uncharacterized protein LOC106870173 [Octopus bimaculoides]|uniref:Death domain-containing protein n=1 Tax=Octopus bimaculoides TaxID=37653 RepID=A0A0L8HKC4_OCTBM|nr:uncharacterized protein LOC106870173 [Octopus bimaculoides]|eukprot:XP_014771658.1 PREDICTED: uncharacterized protein LOC106870173 [Octopus bimaculoides]